MPNSQQRASGQVLVIVAVLMLVLMGLSALVWDVGQIMLADNRLQASVDLAALAGAAELESNPGQAASVALEYAERNGLQRQDTSVRASKHAIEVTATRVVRLFFPIIWGYNSAQISASAVAEVYGEQAAAFDYALFSASEVDDFRIPGSMQVVEGRVHINQDMIISGHDNSFLQEVEIVGILKDSKNNNTFGQLINPAPVLPVPQYKADDLRLQASKVYDSNVSFSNVVADGIIFVNGNVNISGNGIKGRGIIVATGSINISSSEFRYESANDLVAFYALGGYISLSGSDGHFDGVWYAPNGEIRIPGSRNTFFGSLVAQHFAIPGSDNRFVYDPRARSAGGGRGVRLVR